MTDGVRYDTGPDGAFYHALVIHVREADKAGNIVTYRQEPDGTLVKTGLIEKVDPQVRGVAAQQRPAVCCVLHNNITSTFLCFVRKLLYGALRTWILMVFLENVALRNTSVAC